MITRCLSASPLRSLVPAALLLCSLAPLASAQTVTAPTVITSAPYTITTSGKYVLAYSLSYTAGGGPAITVSASNVNLDLGGYYVSGSGNTGSNDPVILVNDVAGVVIKNGTVANEGVGIRFSGQTDPRDYDVENVTFTRIYAFGLTFDHPVIAAKVFACKFSNLGGTSQQTDPIAIVTRGGVRVEKNTIDTVANSTGGNVGSALQAQTLSAGPDSAIGNTVSNCYIGIGGYTFLDNLTTNVTIPFYGNSATGNLSVQPNDNND